VPLDPYGTHYATIDKEAYRRVREAGAISPWVLNDNGKGRCFVRTSVMTGKGRKTLVTVARLVAGAGPKETVRFVSRDQLDFRSENLLVTRGGKAKRNDGALARRSKTVRQERRSKAGA
jgi:hypothetical protein